MTTLTLNDRLISAYYHRLMRVEEELRRERSFRYQNVVRIVTLKKLRLQLKDRILRLMAQRRADARLRREARAVKAAAKPRMRRRLRHQGAPLVEE